MSADSEAQEKYMSIKEVSDQSGIGASTIRYYDQQFEDYLEIKRGKGRRRLFTAESVERLMNLHRMLKEQGLSIRQARQALVGDCDPVPPLQDLGGMESDLTDLKAEVEGLKRQVAELKEIQIRTLALLDEIT